MTNSVKSFRKSLNMTQKELAHALGVTYQMISLYENNKKIPSLKMYYRMLKIAEKNNLKLNLEDLVNK